MQLYIGNKNYSSWSMRAWLVMTQFAIEFTAGAAAHR
jgi:glutathione S-transferase